MKTFNTIFLVATFFMFGQSQAYEINNHADMSQTAIVRSILGQEIGPNRKLFRLGLRAVDLDNTKQTFPLDADLGPIPYCFGSSKPEPWRVTMRDAGEFAAVTARPAQDASVAQPGWMAVGGAKLTIAQMIRYGACYEDEEEPNIRSLAHFYNPQNGGAGLSETGLPLGPNSMEWMLKRDVSTGILGKAGVNHFTYMDARDFFYKALTTPSTDIARNRYWGLTFQSLGHIVHHLQDMGSPQHVRNDAHCTNPKFCREALGLYRPSGYETYFEQRFQFVQSLASTASAPILFGLPREFWNMNTNDALATTNPAGPMGPDQGIAAFTSTNFTSVGKDFEADISMINGLSFKPASGLAFPKPSGTWNDVNITDLYPASQVGVATAIVNNLCAGNASNCKMRFMGTVDAPAARTSSASIFSQELLRPANTFSGKGVFQQNYFTFNDAAKTLIPKAVEYSAGLINYFFRGEMEISLPDEGVYGIVDHAVEKTKGSDGFRLIKMKVKNTTPAINSTRGVIAQHMTNGEFRAVAKFRRNTCYTPNLMGQIGTVGRGANVITNNPIGCRSLVDEIVVSNPEPVVKSLVAGDAAATLAFDFPNPIPIEATDLFLQVVFKGTLGEELDAVAVTTKDVSEPSFVGFMESTDYRVCSAEMVANWDPYDVLGCPRWSPDSGPTPVTQPMGSSIVTAQSVDRVFAAWSTPEYARWLGLGADNDTVLARLPAEGIPPGSFLRLAVIGDADVTDMNLRHSVTTTSPDMWIKTFRDAPYVVNAADYPRATSAIVLTKVQGDENDVVPPETLPMYWAPRGVVLAAWRDRGALTGDEMPAPVIYRGEPLWGQDIDVYKTGLLTLPPNKTILDLSYYPAMLSVPVQFDRIDFARGSTTKVPATYANFLTQPYINGLGLAEDKKPIWAYFDAKSYALQHTMSFRALRLW
jgi:hypothetical protein